MIDPYDFQERVAIRTYCAGMTESESVRLTKDEMTPKSDIPACVKKALELQKIQPQTMKPRIKVGIKAKGNRYNYEN